MAEDLYMVKETTRELINSLRRVKVTKQFNFYAFSECRNIVCKC